MLRGGGVKDSGGSRKIYEERETRIFFCIRGVIS